ncbi:MAG: glycosyltransferase family 4 protein [Candidatus Thermoplasmatota archaeon]|nr:glycosyltransferase family 4 protein [Candidatus Thermoplasmatota archaeon]
MNIAMISLQYGKSITGGGGVHVEEIVSRLVELGHRVTVLSIHTSKTVTKSESGENPAIVRFLVEENIEHPYVGSKDEELRRIRKFCEIVAEWLIIHGKEFDVAHMHGHHMVVGLLPRLVRNNIKRVVTTVHAVESLYEMEKMATGHSEGDEEHIRGLRRKESEYRFADAIVAPSPAVKEQIFDLMEEFGIALDEVENRIKVITSGIDDGMLIPVEAIEEKLGTNPRSCGKLNVILLSRIDPSKGIQFAIEGLEKAAGKKNIDIALWIVGRVSVDSYLDELKEMAGRSTINIEFHIDVSEERKLELLDKAAVYILPTLQDTFGITVVEAGARGNIIVTTDTVGPRFVIDGPTAVEHDWGVVTDYGVAANKTDEPLMNLSENLSRGIEWVLDHWEESIGMTVAFRDKIKRDYMWDAIVRAYVDLYRK